MVYPNIAKADAASANKTSNVAEPKPAELSADQRAEIGVKKATCPFVGTKVKQGALKVYFAPGDVKKEHPLAKISDVVALGNSGGGTLGYALGFFAKANHSVIPGTKPEVKVPDGYFSLEFGGAKGSHFGDSGFVRNGPTGDGAFGSAKWDAFVNDPKFVTDKKTTSMVQLAKFIASNVEKDPNADRGFKNVLDAAGKTLGDLKVLADKARRMDSMKEADKQKLVEDFGRVLGSNNLIGSAGEFALQTALLRNSPSTDAKNPFNPKFNVQEMGNMFRMVGFPAGEGNAKSAVQWMVDSIELGSLAMAEYAKNHSKMAVVDQFKHLSENLKAAGGWAKK